MAKVTVPVIRALKERGEKIVALTAYDVGLARLLDRAGVDILLVGDSVGVVVAGYDTTLPVTMDEMVYHTRAVVRGRTHALVVADMPYLSYQVGLREARRNAGRLVQEGGAEAVKVEGGRATAPVIRALAGMDVPVMAHIGLTPQSIHRMGGYRVQGRTAEDRKRLWDDAQAVERAGAFAVVLEGIPADLAAEVTAALAIPTIGIGAGPHCDGQVLVVHDMLGLFDRFTPTFVKRYADLAPVITTAVTAYRDDVKAGRFPTEEQTYR